MIERTQSDLAGLGGLRRAPRSDGRRLIVLLPLVLFSAISAVFAVGLTRDPELLPSTFLGKPVPEFALPPVQGRMAGLSDQDLKGGVSLVNFFASWCVACRAEHPLLLRLALDDVVPVHGINYKDRPEDAAGWLDSLGHPYTRTGVDLDGRVGIDWGVYGLPETFVIDPKGQIVLRHVGALTEHDLSDTILPLARRLQAGAGGVDR